MGEDRYRHKDHGVVTLRERGAYGQEGLVWVEKKKGEWYAVAEEDLVPHSTPTELAEAAEEAAEAAAEEAGPIATPETDATLEVQEEST